MKLKVIGWTSYDNNCFAPARGASLAACSAIIDAIVNDGLCFTGEHMQERDGCVPVLNDGRKYIFSRRGFGGIMAEAHGYKGAYDYALFSDNYSFDDAVFPKNAVRSKQDVEGKIESDLNECFDFSNEKFSLRANLDEGIEDAVEITVPYNDTTRYVGVGDTVIVGGEIFTVLDSFSRKDIDDTMQALQFSFLDDDKYAEAEDAYANAPVLVVLTAKKLS